MWDRPTSALSLARPAGRGCRGPKVRGRVRAIVGRESAAVPLPTACYSTDMLNKMAAKDKRRRTTMVPVTTMEELPMLFEKERAELRGSLDQAEGRIKVDYDPKTFKQRLVGIMGARS